MIFSFLVSESSDSQRPLDLNDRKNIIKINKSHLRCRCSLISWKQQSSEPLNRWQQHPWTTGRTKTTNNRGPLMAGFIWLRSGGLLLGGWRGWTSCTGWRAFLADDSTDLRVRTCPSPRRYWPDAIWTYKDGRSTVRGNNALVLFREADQLTWHGTFDFPHRRGERNH